MQNQNSVNHNYYNININNNNNQPQPNNNMNNPQQMQFLMNNPEFEMKKQQYRQMGVLLRKQKEMADRLKAQEEERNKRNEEDREIILFFNHNYNILPLTFKQSTMICEALNEYIKQTNKVNAKFKFENTELKIDNFQSLKEIKGMSNGSEITVEC